MFEEKFAASIKIVKYEGKNPVKSKVKILSRFAQFANKRNFTVPPWFRKENRQPDESPRGLSVFNIRSDIPFM